MDVIGFVNPAELRLLPAHLRVVRSRTMLWRIHRTSGENVVPCNQLRYWGPAATAPSLSLPLNHPGLRQYVHASAAEIGYRLV